MNPIKFAVLAVFLALIGCAGMQPAKESSIESVIEVPGHTKDQIYTATKIWIAENFRSAKAVIENDDKESGRIIGNGRIKYPCSGFSCLGQSDWTLDFTMRVDMKDQKMKLTFSNLGISWPYSQSAPSADHLPVREDQMSDVRPALIKLGDELRAAIDKEQTKANW